MSGIDLTLTDDGNLKDFGDAMGDGIEDVMFRVENKVANWIQNRTPTAVTANLRNLTKAERPAKFGEAWMGYVGNPLNYSEFILGKGAGPAAGHAKFFPPLAPLVLWVRRRGLAGKYSLKTRKRLGGKNTQAAEDIRMARAIQHKISIRGIKGLDLIGQAEEMLTRDTETGVRASMAEIEKRFSD